MGRVRRLRVGRQEDGAGTGGIADSVGAVAADRHTSVSRRVVERTVAAAEVTAVY